MSDMSKKLEDILNIIGISLKSDKNNFSKENQEIIIKAMTYVANELKKSNYEGYDSRFQNLVIALDDIIEELLFLIEMYNSKNSQEFKEHNLFKLTSRQIKELQEKKHTSILVNGIKKTITLDDLYVGKEDVDKMLDDRRL